MHKSLSVLVSVLFAIIAAPSATHAYNGTVTDIRSGEHPYETRKREENRRKDLAKEFKKHGYATFESPVYYHPIYAKKSVLHPFYRKGGTSVYFDGRFARWRGYVDPIRAHELSPDTYCSNFYYRSFRGAVSPTGYDCF